MKLILAPMDAITHLAFRNIVGRFGGCDEYFNEMINASSLLNNGPWEKYYLFDGPEPEKLVWQLTDKSGGKMAQAAAVCQDLCGLGIDLNMGCSAPQIYKTGAGIAWMTKPAAETAKMVRDVKTAMENSAKDGNPVKRLSVKMRLGTEDWTPQKLHDFTKMLIEEGVQLITLHGRTQKQKHSRPSNWKAVEELAQAFPQIPVYLNGDVKDFNSFEAAKKTAPSAAGIMIATAAAQKPWIFAQLKKGGESLPLAPKDGSFDGAQPPSFSATPSNGAHPRNAPQTFDAQQLALDFIDDVEKYQPPEFYKTRLQRFFAWYCLNFSFGHFFQSSMINAKDNDDARRRINEYFEKCPGDKIKAI